MDRDSCLALVRDLTAQVLAAVRPDKLTDFSDDFAAFALVAGVPGAAENLAQPRPATTGIETTLVAGMFFEVLMDAARLPAGPRERVSFVRKRAKDYLVTRLAGQITLSQFYRLLNLIETKAGDYFQHLTDDWTGPSRPREAALSAAPETVDAAALSEALARLTLPLKGRRKFTPETLEDFLYRTGGRWFKLLDLETHFQVNKKTAWSYLNLLLSEGVLEHNGEKANKVRYALAPAFRTEPVS
jgi:hypothetical protein